MQALKSVLPNVYQHVTCATRWKNTLDHLLSTHRDAYKALPRPPFGKSDHNSILLIPAFKQKLKQGAPVTRSRKKWSDNADAKLQDWFASKDWNPHNEMAQTEMVTSLPFLIMYYFLHC